MEVIRLRFKIDFELLRNVTLRSLLVTCHGGTSRWFKKPVKRIYRIWIQRLGKLTLSILQTRKVLSQLGCGRSICQLYLDLLNLIIHLRFICSILGEECHSHRIIRHQECHVHRITRNRAVVLQLNIEIWQTFSNRNAPTVCKIAPFFWSWVINSDLFWGDQTSSKCCW